MCLSVGPFSETHSIRKSAACCNHGRECVPLGVVDAAASNRAADAVGEKGKSTAVSGWKNISTRRPVPPLEANGMVVEAFGSFLLFLTFHPITVDGGRRHRQVSWQRHHRRFPRGRRRTSPMVSQLPPPPPATVHLTFLDWASAPPSLSR